MFLHTYKVFLSNASNFFVGLGRFSRLYLVSRVEMMNVRPCQLAKTDTSLSLMTSSLLSQLCPACLVRLVRWSGTWQYCYCFVWCDFCMMGGKWQCSFCAVLHTFFLREIWPQNNYRNITFTAITAKVFLLLCFSIASELKSRNFNVF